MRKPRAIRFLVGNKSQNNNNKEKHDRDEPLHSRNSTHVCQEQEKVVEKQKEKSRRNAYRSSDKNDLKNGEIPFNCVGKALFQHGLKITFRCILKFFTSVKDSSSIKKCPIWLSTFPELAIILINPFSNQYINIVFLLRQTETSLVSSSLSVLKSLHYR